MPKLQTSRRVHAADFGDDWPLTVASAGLRVERGAMMIVAGGRHFALNSAASTWLRRAAVQEYDLRTIWLDDPNKSSGVKKSLAPLIALASELDDAAADARERRKRKRDMRRWFKRNRRKQRIG